MPLHIELQEYLYLYMDEKFENENNFEQFSILLFNFIEKNKILLKKMNNIFINEGPGNFSGIRTSIAVAKGISIIRKINLFHFCSCYQKVTKRTLFFHIVCIFKAFAQHG